MHAIKSIVTINTVDSDVRSIDLYVRGAAQRISLVR